MLNYVITYCKDTKEFMEELEDLAPSYLTKDMSGDVVGWSIQTTPIIKNDNGSLAMSILTDDELDFLSTMTTIRSLGTYEELFADEESHALYKSVYPYDVPLIMTDFDGNEFEYFRPKEIGGFA